MHKYSQKSKLHLSTCHKDLQIVFNHVIKYWDCSVIWGHRGKDDQNKAWIQGYSKLRYPKSKHNKLPSLAVDVVPYPTLWKDEPEMIRFGKFVKWFADVLYDMGDIKSKIDWGGDWKNFIDMAHWEISTKKPNRIKTGSMADHLINN